VKIEKGKSLFVAGATGEAAEPQPVAIADAGIQSAVVGAAKPALGCKEEANAPVHGGSVVDDLGLLLLLPNLCLPALCAKILFIILSPSLLSRKAAFTGRSHFTTTTGR